MARRNRRNKQSSASPNQPRPLSPLHDITRAEFLIGRPDEYELDQVLIGVTGMLELAKRGLKQIQSGSVDSQLTGVCDVAVYGRSVTNASKRARRNVRVEFTAWYKPWRDEMTSDELFQFFERIRNEVIHEGFPPTMTIRTPLNSRSLTKLTEALLHQVFPELDDPGSYQSLEIAFAEPQRAAHCTIVFRDGSTKKEWIAFPDSVPLDWSTSTYLPSPPKLHLGAPILDVTLQNLATLYISRLEAFRSEFAKFITSVKT